MYTTILVPLDGSDLAARAVPYATLLARAARGKLVLFHAASERALTDDAASEIQLILFEDRLAEQLTQDGVPTVAHTARGNTGASIVGELSAVRADLVVMSTHGRSGMDRLVHGSTAAYLLHHTAVPILAVGPACTREWTADCRLRLLVPLDGSELAEEALGPVMALTQTLPAEITLLCIAEERLGMDALGFGRREPVTAKDLAAARQYLEEVAARLREAGQETTILVETGPPVDVIAQLTEREAIDLVVMATRGRGSLRDMLLGRLATVVTAGRVPLHLGSVAAATLRSASAPVLLVRPSAEATVPAPSTSTREPARPAS